MNNTIERIVAWYEKRREREYYPELTHAMLVEEYVEWGKSGTDRVNELKELCDIYFTAIGAIWALDELESNESTAIAEYWCTAITEFRPSIWPGFVIGGLLDQNAMGKVDDTAEWLKSIAILASYQMQCMGLTKQQAIRAVLAVCDSNDTKSEAKIPPGEKYSSELKGDNYVSADEALEAILGEADEMAEKIH